MKKNMQERTFFGFTEVTKDEKLFKVNNVFSSVASKYDIMNDAMSFGIHHKWKDHLLSMMPNSKAKLLDIAGGTGDIALRFHNKATKAGFQPDITICDINADMLEAGKQKSINQNILTGIDFINGNAENLPFDDESFDYVTIAFGIRNVVDITKVLSESYRVLRPTGKFLCLEFAHVDNNLLNKLYDIYSFHVIPHIGKLIANDQDAYRYLVESIRKFPQQEQFAQLISEAGFKRVRYKNLTYGVTAIHSAYKIC